MACSFLSCCPTDCLHFAEALIDAFGLRQQFPQWLKNLSETAVESPRIASVVDSFWGYATWCMEAGRPSSDHRSSTCCATTNHTSMYENWRQSPSVNNASRCCAENSWDRDETETVQQKGAHDVGNDTEVVFQVTDRMISCDCNAFSLCSSGCTGWARRPKRATSICGASICNDGSQCVVFSFTRTGMGKAEICFEIVQALGQPLEDPKDPKLLWDGGSSQAVWQAIVHKLTSQAKSSVSGVLLYEGVPDEMLDGGDKDIEFEFSFSEYNSIPLKVDSV